MRGTIRAGDQEAKAATIHGMQSRRCRVTVGPDPVDAISHAIDIEASSFYEAAVCGLEALQRDQWTPAWIADVTPIVVTTADTGVTHTLRVKSIKEWIARTGGSPNELLQRRQLRERLAERGIML